VKRLREDLKLVIYSIDSSKVIFSDFRDVVLEEKADLVFADPPFGIGFRGDLSSYHRIPNVYSYIEVSEEEYPDFIKDLIGWSYRALKDSGSMWLLSAWKKLDIVLPVIKASGFHLLNHCIWKYQFGVFTKRRFTLSHYHLLLLIKDPKNYTFNKPEHYAEDVWFIKRRYQPGIKKAANELPDELVEKCIYTSSNEGDLVIDPVLGSGTTLKACLKMKRRSIGVEINSELKERIETKIGLELREELE